MKLKIPRLIKIRRLLFKFLSIAIPKQSGLLVFYPTHNKNGFSGNLKSFFVYMHNRPEKDFQMIWCTNNIETYNMLKALNYRVVMNKLMVHYQLLRAEFIIQDSTYTWLIGNFSIVQLWHGNGFKTIALLDKTNPPAKLPLLREAYSHYRLIAASSDQDKNYLIPSFENNNVYVVGSPKNDIFFQDNILNQKLKANYELSSYDQIYAYTPTFRDFGAFDPFSMDFWEALNQWLLSRNYIFVVKKHPWDKTLVIPGNFSNIRDYTTKINDVQELLIITDVLVSDYSAIVTDFSITGKPILFYIHDYDTYTQMREFYYDLKTLLPGPFIYDSDTLLKALKDRSWFEKEEYQEQYTRFRGTFHKFLDGNSSKRVLEKIKQIRIN